MWGNQLFGMFAGILACLALGCVGATGDTGYAPAPQDSTNTQNQPSGPSCNSTGSSSLVCEGSPGPASNSDSCPFVGHTNKEGDSFSCTTCPDGISWLSGTWMFFQNQPGDAPFLDVLEVNGNHFKETIIGEDKILAPGQETTAILKGYFFCPKKEEFTSLRKILVIESVEPSDGLFGNHAGDSFPCDVLGNGSGKSFLLWCDYDWTGSPPLNTQYEYCRDGATVEGAVCEIPSL